MKHSHLPGPRAAGRRNHQTLRSSFNARATLRRRHRLGALRVRHDQRQRASAHRLRAIHTRESLLQLPAGRRRVWCFTPRPGFTFVNAAFANGGGCQCASGAKSPFAPANPFPVTGVTPCATERLGYNERAPLSPQAARCGNNIAKHRPREWVSPPTRVTTHKVQLQLTEFVRSMRRRQLAGQY